MSKWKFTSYEDGQEINGLSHDDAVRAIYRAMAGQSPVEVKAEVRQIEQREPVTAERELIAA